MTIKNKITTLLLVASASFYGQETLNQQDSIVKKEVKISYLDSIKATFVNDEMASCIDSLWMKDLASLDLYNDMITDIKNVDVDQKVDFELPTELLKERLKKMDEKSPFNIEYNIGLENVIKSFLKNRRKSFERLLGVSQYYFPLFEEELAKNNIPLEIKYLAVVESALNPKAVSRVGATGLWQFMYQTGKQYGLNIDSYVDDRSEPLKSSQAASQYMNNMYKIFGDWDLVLAAYNSGPGNVAKAIRRSGGQQNYWNIRKNLPKETQGYLPAFLATMYIFEYHKEHGIVPNKAVANLFATDTVMIKNHMTFKQVSDLLDVPVAEIQFFNPSFKRNEIPSITGEQHFLRLPKDKIAIFTSNEDKVYAYVQHEANKRERPNERLASVKRNDSTNVSFTEREFVSRTKYHKVRRGDNLSEIADKYNVSVAEIKKWNNLKSNSAPKGRSLKIVTVERIAYKDNKEKVKTVSDDTISAKVKNTAVAVKEPKAEKVYKTEKVVTFKDVVKSHKVKSGDNLGGIASKYDVSVAEIKKWNKLKGDNIALGANLKIIKNEKVTTTVRKEIKQSLADKNEDLAVVEHKNSKSDKAKKEEKPDTTSKSENYYVVAKGDNLFTIAKKNNVTIDNIKQWNNMLDNNVKVGSQLIISNESLAEAREEDTKPKGEVKNIEHVVGKGEFLGTIARKYNVSINNLLEWNSLSDTNIKLGDKLIVGKEEVVVKDKKSKKEAFAYNDKKDRENLYQVRKGDTLLKISQKFPGVTIADIKKWNNIKGESIKPGMKLKING
ncbi:LysM peptidoglycan-binding domain-containing protein [Flavobacterium sp. SUN052]|uniref:LysM peptidoglycan-binding domain-containing protein n=1 Tax=Flavobacterium sp. SUN052 TaxID=3002441 RepID=UPI00237E0EB9|nr:LysM peptidoglycan-binding domain-containing protein [Flavobacterium sp. SUN052]MEC4003564.1 LysM peptidoglycan-binding domain-containing protein [Flavobacterium sp. SUN052]